MKLDDKRLKFVLEYMKDLNGRRSAISAGYSAKTADQAASRLLRDVKVRGKLDELQEEQKKKALVSVDFVILGLKEIAVRCMQGVEKTDKTGHPIGVWEFDSAGGNRALELLGKHLNVFKEENPIKDLLSGLTVNVTKNYGKDG